MPYKGNDQLSGNWDLSAKRATANVNILRENPFSGARKNAQRHRQALSR
jgi:flagellar motor protein MotB